MDNNYEVLAKRLSAGMAEAILGTCAEHKEHVIEFLMDYIDEYADDAFYNGMIRLCDEYGLPVFDDDDEIPLPEFDPDFKFVSINSI